MSCISTYAIERSSIKMIMTFTDPEGVPVTPETINWTLTNSDGITINGRDLVGIVPTSNVEEAFLFGDDLLVLPEERHLTIIDRYFIVNATCMQGLTTYPINDYILFKVKNLLSIS